MSIISIFLGSSILIAFLFFIIHFEGVIDNFFNFSYDFSEEVNSTDFDLNFFFLGVSNIALSFSSFIELLSIAENYTLSSS